MLVLITVLSVIVPLLLVPLVMLLAEAIVSLSAVNVVLTYCSAVMKAILKGEDSKTKRGLAACLKLNKPP